MKWLDMFWSSNHSHYIPGMDNITQTLQKRTHFTISIPSLSAFTAWSLPTPLSCEERENSLELSAFSFSNLCLQRLNIKQRKTWRKMYKYKYKHSWWGTENLILLKLQHLAYLSLQYEPLFSIWTRKLNFYFVTILLWQELFVCY